MNTATIGEIGQVISGFAFKSASFGDDGVPVIKIANIRDGDVDLSSAQFVDEGFLTKLHSKYQVHPGDTLISLTGSHVTQPNSVVGRVARMGRGMPVCLLNQRAGKVILNDSVMCDRDFLYWSLRGREVRAQIAQMAHGAASQANVSPRQVESLEINLPPLQEQHRIASILSAYDDLIENNTRRIAILEEMARRLYQEWFVHFRFPGHDKVKLVDSELGEIPEGWEVAKLADEAKIVMGQSPKSEFYNDQGDGLPFHQGVKDFGPYFPTDRLFCTIQNRTAEENDILFSVRAPVGRINISTKRIVIGRGLSAIQSKFGHQGFLLNQLRDKFSEEDTIGGGTIFKAVTKKDMHDIQLLRPPEGLQTLFESHTDPCWRLIRLHTEKNANLRTQRDLLLPKLISGEIDVSRLPASEESAAA